MATEEQANELIDTEADKPKRGRPAKTEAVDTESTESVETEAVEDMVGIFSIKKYTIMDGPAPTVIHEGYQVVSGEIAKHPYHAMVGTKILGKIDPNAIDGAETRQRIDSWLVTLGSIESGIFDAMGSLLNITDAQKKALTDSAELLKKAQEKINSIVG